MLIARIQRTKFRLARYRVTFEDGTSIDLSEDIFVRSALAAGDELTERQFAELRNSQEEFDARRIAVNYLSYRPRTEKEVLQHLIKKGVSVRIATEAAARLRDLRMIDDSAFARMFVRDKVRKGASGPRLLRQQLLQKGVRRAEADLILAELVPEEAQDGAALKLARRYLEKRSGVRKLEPAKRRQRVYDLLMRKGFSSETARKTMTLIKV